MDSGSQSPGICRRLINFLLGKLRRPPALLPSSRVPVEEGSSSNGKDSTRPNGFLDSEIVVEFRHIDGSGGRTQTNRRGGPILAPKKDGLIVSNDQTMLQNGMDEGEGNKYHFASRVDQKTGTQERDARGKGPKGSVTTKETEGKKEAIHSSDQAAAGSNQPHDETKPRPPRQHWALLSVASNINEKSDAYIEKRKKIMGRNYTLDAEKS